MQWTGNVGRTVGQLLLALGIIALVLGVLGLVLGGLLFRDAANDPALRGDDVGEMLEVFIGGGLVLTGAGTLLVLAAIVVLGVARALRDRFERRQGTPTPAAASTRSPTP